MSFATLANILIIIHATAGSIALVSGSISMIARKGNRWHTKSGLFFYWGMVLTGVTALIITALPGHHSYFLFAIGVFSLYLVISGREFLRFKTIRSKQELRKHRILSTIMAAFGVAMLVMGTWELLQQRQLGILLLFFGGIGLSMAIQDFRAFRDIKRLRKKWLRGHITKIVGAFIAASTAFIVVNDVFHPLVNWLVPTVPGTLYSIYWTRKVSPKNTKSAPKPKESIHQN